MTDSKVISSTHKNFDEIMKFISNFKDGDKYEILFHPGKFDSNCKSSYNKQREEDVENIIKLNRIFEKEGIKLINYREL